MPFKDIIKELMLLLIVAVIAAFVVNLFSPKGIALIGEWDTARGVVTAKPKNDVVAHELEIDDILMAKEIWDSGKAVFIDARDYQTYKEGHIKGAASMPVYQFEELIKAFKQDYPPYVTIVTYCSGRECDDSHLLAQCLLDEGYTDVKVFIDGYTGWEEEGFPIDKY